MAEFKRHFIGFLVAASICVGVLPSSVVYSSSEMDQKYALESVAALQAWDNVDGLFAEYIQDAYQAYFDTQSRFVLKSVGRANPALTESQIPYSRVIDDIDLLAQVARQIKVQTLLRTRVFKEGPSYRFQIEWLIAPKMETLSKVGFKMQEPANGEPLAGDKIRGEVRRALDELFSKLPFVGHVTGRDRQWVTANLGGMSQARVGEIFVLGTIEDVRKHPLLGSLEDWRLSESGRVEVVQVEPRISFCKVIDEDPSKPIDALQKIVKRLPPAEPTPQITKEGGPAVNAEGIITGDDDSDPRLGWLGVTLWMGNFNREVTSGSTSIANGGFLLGARGTGQLWFTERFFGELDYGFSSVGGDRSISRFAIDAGYSYFITEGDPMGARGWVKLGYRALNYTLPIDVPSSSGPALFSSVFFGLGGELPIRTGFGVLMSLDLGLMKSYEESGIYNGQVIGVTDASFYAGAYYRVEKKLTVRLGLDMMAQSAEFDTAKAVNHRIYSFGPSILFFF